MSKLIFKLRNVPEDEAHEMRELMYRNAIEIFETDAGNWGVSMPGLWLTDAGDFDRADKLIQRYQAERATEAKDHHAEAKRKGTHRTLSDVLQERPLAMLGLVLFCLLILYFSIKPYLDLISATH